MHNGASGIPHANEIYFRLRIAIANTASKEKIFHQALRESAKRSLKSSWVKRLSQICSDSACCFAAVNRCHPKGNRMTPRIRPLAALPFLDLDALKSIGKASVIQGRAILWESFTNGDQSAMRFHT